ncbi:MAG: DUF2326 domain-containing protein [Pseudomonadota bacterium]
MQDNHNLGKTFLISVIDFALLGGIDKRHQFRKHPKAFNQFTFFVEVKSDAGSYITVRRSVASGRKTISIQTSTESRSQLTLPGDEWEFPGLGVDKARTIFDRLLGLSVLNRHGYSFRKGLTYSLRRQSDYHDEFRLSRFAIGRDRDWKPYVASVLGLDGDLVRKKYDLDDELKDLEAQLDDIERRANASSAEYDELAGTIELRSEAVKNLRVRVKAFSFADIEAELTDSLVNDIEAKISRYNETMYSIDYQLREIQESVETKISFDLRQVEELYREIEVFFPEELSRSLEEFVAFNQGISTERTKRLLETRQRLTIQRQQIAEQLRDLDQQRASALALLGESDTLEKFRKAQAELLHEEEELLALRKRLESLDEAEPVRSRIREVKAEVERAKNMIGEMTRATSDLFREIRKKYSDYAQSIINLQALLSVVQNDSGNADFVVKTLDKKVLEKETSESGGTTYKKILCACFDMALVDTYAEEPYFHFIYHDGIFEGLDNRKKVDLLNTVRRMCEERGAQYVLTVIDSDLPRDERDNKLLFSEHEVIRELHDGGQDGRLFRMSTF